MTDQTVIENRLQLLEKHLQKENPVLLNAVQSFRELDKIARKMGLLGQNESFATSIPWWPMISVLGTFSAGKSTFINNYLGMQLQRSGNQAVDDRFTVICYSEDVEAHTLPGVSLDSDPRFPFYKISREIDAVSEGEGNRIDAYLQLKTCNSPRLKGKILIDSPGFDADAQRTSTLRITDHMVDLSDLVLVFFDARHPEPGAMRDTLEHLVANTIDRPDSGKFLYILNQIDTTAREDNPEDVIAAWQRALGEYGLTAGRFYTIYSTSVSIQIDDEKLRARYEAKRDRDLEEIYQRMGQVETERAYRIISSLEKTSRDIEDKVVPLLTDALGRWKTRTLWFDGIAFGALAIIAFSLRNSALGRWFTETDLHIGILLAMIGAVLYGVHLGMRKLAATSLLPWLKKEQKKLSIKGNIVNAFKQNTQFWQPLFRTTPSGWRRSTQAMLAKVLSQADHYVQQLNDHFTNPSGIDKQASQVETKVESNPTESATEKG